jgi:hypothetical protein
MGDQADRWLSPPFDSGGQKGTLVMLSKVIAMCDRVRFVRRRRAAALAEALGLSFGRGRGTGRYYVIDASREPIAVVKHGTLGQTLRYLEVALNEATS